MCDLLSLCVSQIIFIKRDLNQSIKHVQYFIKVVYYILLRSVILRILSRVRNFESSRLPFYTDQFFLLNEISSNFFFLFKNRKPQIKGVHAKVSRTQWKGHSE